MSEQAILWLFGILIGALFALIGTIAKVMWARIAAIDSGALASFEAMDHEREKQWQMWRDAIDKRLDRKRESIEDHERRIIRLERNGNH